MKSAAFLRWSSDSHPEWWSVAIAAAAWAALLIPDSSPYPTICLGSAPRLLGTAGAYLGVARGTGMFGRMLTEWLVMTAAMLPILAIPMVRNVAARSFAWRRNRAIAAFLTGAACAWTMSSIVLVAPAAIVGLAAQASGWAAVCGFLAACAWQLSPYKIKALQACHRTEPLSAFGAQADRDCLHAGWSYGLRCVLACGGMMAAAMLSHGVAAMACVQMIAIRERSYEAAPLRCLVSLVCCAALPFI